MTQGRSRSKERGSILLMVLVFILMMSMLGALTLQTVSKEIDVVGAERQAEHAFYTAEAGLAWGRHQLTSQFGPVDIDYATLFATLPLIAEPNEPFDGWYEVGTQGYAGGTFRVAVKDDDHSETGASPNNTILMRSLGVGPGGSSGAERLLEVVLIGQ